MNTDRIKEIQQETAYPDSVSVQQALLKVWNECEQENTVKNNAVLPLVSGSAMLKDLLSAQQEIISSPIRFNGVSNNDIKRIFSKYGIDYKQPF